MKTTFQKELCYIDCNIQMNIHGLRPVLKLFCLRQKVERPQRAIAIYSQ